MVATALPVVLGLLVFWVGRAHSGVAAPGPHHEPKLAKPSQALAGDEPLAGARWVVPLNASSIGGSLLRLNFHVDSAVVKGDVWFAGLGHGELWLDGARVGDAVLEAGWTNYNRTCLYMHHQLPQLAGGPHTFGVVLGNGMYHVRRIPDRYTKFVGSMGPRALIFHARLAFSDGSVLDLRSGGENADTFGWEALSSAGPVVVSHTYGGEDVDARLWPADWNARVESPSHVASQWSPVQTWEGPGCLLVESEVAPMRVIELFPTVTSWDIAEAGRVYDVGSNIMGWPVLEVYGEAGARVELVCGETLGNDGLPSQRISGAPHWYSYTLRGGSTSASPELWSPRFSFYGFRWVLARLSGNATVASLKGARVHSDAPVAGHFNSSTPLFLRTHEIILASIRANLGSVYMDCPHREKLGWLETVHLMAPSVVHNFVVAPMFKKVLRDMAEAQHENGLVPDIAPEYTGWAGGFLDSPEWGSSFVYLADWLWQIYGDSSGAAENYEAMARYMTYLRTKGTGAGPNLILAYGLGDWCDANSEASGDCGAPGQFTKLGVTGTAIFYGSAVRMAQFAARLPGRSADAPYWQSLAANISAAFHTTFWQGDKGTYGSQAANGMALALDLVPAAARQAALASLVADVKARGTHQTGGDIGHRYVIQALADAGETALLFALHESTSYPSYGYMLGLPNTTSLAEQWSGAGSQLHSMLGQVEEWFWEVHLGLRAMSASNNLGGEADGPPVFIVAPAPHGRTAGVHSASGSYISPHCGNISVSWHLHVPDGKLHMEVAAPEGQCTLEVHVPSDQPEAHSAVAVVRGVARHVAAVRRASVFRIDPQREGREVAFQTTCAGCIVTELDPTLQQAALFESLI